MRLLITSGRGPAECRVAIRAVADAITKEAAAVGLDVIEIADKDHPQGHGPASIVLMVDGDALTQPWLGTIKYVWESTIRPNHKRKNWFVSVSKLSDATEKGRLDQSKIEFSTMRAGGPGGQHQNTTDSAVRASYDGVSIVVRDGRSQHQNKQLAIRRLEEYLDVQQRMELAALRDEAQLAHDNLERGNAVKTIKA